MHDVDSIDVYVSAIPLSELDDGELLTITRAGHHDAYAELYERYRYASLRLARHLGQKDEADDIVSESFARILDLLSRDKGPDRAFRAYLFTTVRHECGRRAKAQKQVRPTDDIRQIDVPVAFGDNELDDFERSTIRAAYESLPLRWRTVLWHLDVEGRKPLELGPLLDLSPNSVSALVYRARSGLRDAYLQQHVNPGGRSSCGKHRAKLSAVVRHTAAAGDNERVHAHLRLCDECHAVYRDLQEVNREVGSVAVPAAIAMPLASVLVLSVIAFPLAEALFALL